MEQQIPEEIKTKRSAQLLALADSMSAEFREYYVGRTQEILFEEPVVMDGQEYYSGYNREYVRFVTKSERALDNCLCRGEVTGKLNDEILCMNCIQ